MRALLVLTVLASYRLTVCTVLASYRLTVCTVCAAQATPYVPLDHWSTPYVEHLIARGALVDPSPLTRPFKAGDLVRALRAVDSLQVRAAAWRATRRILADIERREHGPFGRIDGHVSASAATHALRDPLETRCRPVAAGCAPREGTARGFAEGGLAATLSFGPVVAVTHPYFSTRLKDDPDYYGKGDRVIAGRNAEAYASAQWGFGEVFFGALDRRWGSGLLLSAAPYSYDHFALAVGTTGVRIEALLTQLDDLPDAGGAANHRYFVAHRLVLRPPGRMVISFWEGTILAGPGRQLEPWYANVLNLGLLAQYDQATASNAQVGLDVDVRAGKARIFGSMMLDDLQVDESALTAEEPISYGFTLGAEGPAGPASWSATYTQVSNLAYRTHNPAETVMRRSVGLAQNYSDYDQLTVRAGLLTGPGLLLSPEVTFVRQGEGDFRIPFPPVASFDSTPVFLAGTVERTLRVAARAAWRLGVLQMDADAGMHFVSNANHLQGETDTRFLGRFEMKWAFRRESLLP